MTASLPPPNVALTDPVSGLIAKPWYQYLFENSNTTATFPPGLWTYLPTGNPSLGINQPVLESPVGILLDLPDPTSDRAINIYQRGVTTSVSDLAAPFYWNYIDIDARGAHVAGNGDMAGLQVDLFFGGATAAGQKAGVVGRTVVKSPTGGTAATENFTGIVGLAQGATTLGTNTTTGVGGGAIGYILGANLIGVIGANRKNYQQMTAVECLTTVRTGGSVAVHSGMNIGQMFDHAVSGAELDCGIHIANQSGAIGWKDYGIVFDTVAYGAGTLCQPTATLIGTRGNMAPKRGIDFSSAGFSEYAFASTGFNVSGGGGLRAHRIGYETGSAGSVTQATSKTTAVNLAADCGRIITSASNLANGASATFTFTNANYAATGSPAGDLMLVQHAAGGNVGGYTIAVGFAGVNAVTIRITNVSGGALAQALTLNFCVIRGGL